MTDEVGADGSEAIAIVGMACRVPGARNIEEFWQNLIHGVESIDEFTPDQLAAAGYDSALLKQPGYVNRRGLIPDIDLFDAGFFGFSPREADILDPQQRVFLECAWEAIESAGYDPEKYRGLIATYAGCGTSRYMFQVLSNPTVANTVGSYQIALANDKDHITTRVSYKLNLRGPSFTIQCACSTSLVAVHVACQSLLEFQCDMAVAGGCTIDLPQNIGYFYQEGGISSPDGHCRAFDADARGTVGGNGGGAVLLKRLADALNDGDHIYAVIRGSALTNDGSVKIGYTAPSVKGQAAAIAMAQAAAGVHPDQISYIEAHGTGTPLGDPIEIAALREVFQAKTRRRSFCSIGSVKTNIGHLDTAAGVVGLIKTALALEREAIPPSLNYSSPNPKIDFANSPFRVVTALQPWPRDGKPRFAGVSSFGVGGTNAHVVLEEPPVRSAETSRRTWHLLVSSGRSRSALDAAGDRLAQYLQAHRDLDLADVAYTSQTGRRAFDHRRAWVTRSTADAVDQLSSTARPIGGVRPSEPRRVAFLFPGQGSQRVNMAREIYETEPVFHDEVDRCAAILRPLLDLDLRDVLYPSNDKAAGAEERLRLTGVTQPALFVIEHSLATLLVSWGIKPAGMLGHSVGEYVAAALAGVFSLEHALAIVAERARLMQSLPPGAMLAVMAKPEDLHPVCGDRVLVAAVNAPGECVLSGPDADIASAEAELARRGIACRRLRTSHAFHSPMMDPILEPFRTHLATFELNPPQVPFISNLTGGWIRAAEATDPGYWADHLRNTVRFADGAGRLLEEPNWILLEVGPGHTLASLASRQAVRAPDQLVFTTLSSKGAEPESRSLLAAVGHLWANGVDVDWKAMWAGESRSRTPLPTYPFERKRHWIDSARSGQPAPPASVAAGDLANWFYVPGWVEAPMSAPPAYPAAPGHWLLFADGPGMGARLAQRLRQQGQDVTTVAPGVSYLRSDEQTVVVDPTRREDYVRLLQDLTAFGRTPTHVVHLWSVTREEGPQLESQQAARLLDRGFHSLVLLAQALGESSPQTRCRITVLTNRLHGISGQEGAQAIKATILGPVKVIPQEYPGLEVRSIDLSVALDDETLDEPVLAECRGDAREPLVAYRENRRLVQQYAPVRLNAPSKETVRLRENGVYLITGGLGGIGFVLAEFLARTVKARLVLTARSSLPPPEEWNAWLSHHDEADRISTRIQRVRQLQEAGAEVLVAAADVADLGAMSSVIQDALGRFGALHGVIHAAGVPGGGIIQLKTRDEAERVMLPKVAGTLVLNQLLAELPIDFLALQSSLAAIFGGAGQVDYCSANAFLDAFAFAVAGKSPPTVSINWEHWLEVGMAVDTEAPEEMRRSRAAGPWRGIRSSEGAEAFARVLAGTWPQVIVSTFDFRGMWQQLTVLPAENARSSAAGAPVHDRSELSRAYVAPENSVQTAIAGLLEDLLGVHPVGITDSFFELGGHSLLAIQLVSRLRDVFAIKLPIRAIFDASSVADLALAVEAARADGVENGDAASPLPEGEMEEGEI